MIETRLLRLAFAVPLFALVLAPCSAWAQTPHLLDAQTREMTVVGWRGFLDLPFILDSVGALLLATALGALIGFHPMTPRTVDTLEEAELPKVYMLYAVVGAIIGVIVLKYGMVVGFVVFGIGGLMRFRTNTESTRDTGRLIIVTLIGLIAGLALPHFAVVSALFVFVLIYFFDAHPICRVVVKQIPKDMVALSADSYRGVLHNAGCKILGERKSFGKRRVEFVFRLPRRRTREQLHISLCEVPREVRGEIDWEVE